MRPRPLDKKSFFFFPAVAVSDEARHREEGMVNRPWHASMALSHLSPEGIRECCLHQLSFIYDNKIMFFYSFSMDWWVSAQSSQNVWYFFFMLGWESPKRYSICVVCKYLHNQTIIITRVWGARFAVAFLFIYVTLGYDQEWFIGGFMMAFLVRWQGRRMCDQFPTLAIHSSTTVSPGWCDDAASNRIITAKQHTIYLAPVSGTHQGTWLLHTSQLCFVLANTKMELGWSGFFFFWLGARSSKGPQRVSTAWAWQECLRRELGKLSHTGGMCSERIGLSYIYRIDGRYRPSNQGKKKKGGFHQFGGC